jgi:hypothetical protein
MTTVSLPQIDPRGRLERLSNWLALLALLAGGIIFPGADAPTAAGSGVAASAARSRGSCICSGTQATCCRWSAAVASRPVR